MICTDVNSDLFVSVSVLLNSFEIRKKIRYDKFWYQPAFCIIVLSADKNKWITTRRHCCAFVNTLLPCINKAIHHIQELELKEEKFFQLVSFVKKITILLLQDICNILPTKNSVSCSLCL
ncbi:unnamed protein product [Coccothraustes coccothraustes]